MSVELKQKIVQHEYSTKVCRVGILGGTFDPIHYAHLHLAEVAKEECDLDVIWFLPAQNPPHKQGEEITSSRERLHMLQLALDSVPYFQISLVEYEREGPSYTIQTMQYFAQLYPHYQFFFIIGADMVEYLPQWYRIEELIQLVTFVGMGRPGWSLEKEHLFSQHVQQVELLTSSLSSSAIRQRIKYGKSIRFLVPEKVYHYIKEQGLYA